VAKKSVKRTGRTGGGMPPAASLMFVLLCAAFAFRGLFNSGILSFDAPILIYLVVASFLGLWTAVRHFRLRDKPPVWPVALVLAVPFCFLLSFFGAVAYHGALLALLIHVSFVFVFAYAYVALRSEDARRQAVNVLLLAGHAVVAFGLLHWIGIRLYPDAVGQFSGEYRLMSVWQYANTYGAYLIAMMLVSLFVLSRSASGFIRSLTAGMLPLVMMSIVLTLSRGAWLTIPVLLVIVLVFLPLGRQIAFLIHLLAAAVPAALAFVPASRIGVSQQESFSLVMFLAGFGLLLAVSLAAWGLSRLADRHVIPRLDRLSFLEAKKGSFLWLPAGAVVLAAGIGFLFLKTPLISLLPDHIEQRVAGINFAQHSVLERFSFYADALAISKDYPVLGAGGGAWNVLHEQYQSYPYLSTQVHSFLFQYLVEIGWLGLAVLLAVMAIVLVGAVIRRVRHGLDDATFPFFILVLAILGHALIDFDLSYVSLGALLFFSLGLLAQTMPAFRIREKAGTVLQKSCTAVLSLLVLFVFVFAVRLFDGYLTHVKLNRLIGTGQLSISEIESMLDRMVRLSKHPAHLMLYFQVHRQLYAQTSDPAHLDAAERALEWMDAYEPERRSTEIVRVQWHMMRDDPDQAADVLVEALDRFPWEQMLYEEAVGLLWELGSPDRDEPWNRALDVFSRMEAQMDIVAKLPSYQVPTKEFAISPPLAGTIAKIHLLQDRPEQAYRLLTRYVEADPGFGADDLDSLRAYLGL
jgi:hypothetical protein